MAKRKFTMTSQRADWSKNRSVTLQGEPLRINGAWQDRRARIAEMEVRKMHLDVKSELNRYLKGAKSDYAMDASASSIIESILSRLTKKWTSRFNLFAKDFSKENTAMVNGMAAKDLDKSLEKLSGGMTIKTDTISDRTRDILSGSTKQSTSLIKSIAPDYLSDVQELMMRSVIKPESTFAKTVAEVNSLLIGKYKQYRNKAKNLVLNETKTLYSNLNGQRMQEVGLDEYTWRHGGGVKKPRSYHKNFLNGKVFKLSDPPVINQKTGARGKPGDEIHCSCFMVPVIKLGE